MEIIFIQATYLFTILGLFGSVPFLSGELGNENIFLNFDNLFFVGSTVVLFASADLVSIEHIDEDDIFIPL